ncbi:MAG: hypothetical protein O6952_00585, partial [Planctomycetota bacterium]|nr:hypothetical protein [Planctomycetota bacterium]
MTRTLPLRAAPAVLIIVLCYPVIRPLLTADLFIAHDVFFHITHLHQFERAFHAGAIYPRWFPDVFEGYGAPVGVFYPLLTYYVAEIPRVLGAGIIDSWKWFVALGFIGSGLFQYLWTRKWLGEAGAWVSAIAYIYYPYHILDAYVRGAFPEFLGFVWYPLIAWAVCNVASRPTRRSIALAALPIAALVLTHFPSAVLFLPVAVALGAAGIPEGQSRRGALALAAAVSIGVALAAIAWLPFIAELKWVGLSAKSHHSFVQFENHFVRPGQIVSRYWGFGGSLPPGLEDGMSFQVGWLHLALAPIGVIALIVTENRRRLGVILAALLVLGLFLMLRPSDFLWRAIPVIRQVQFPWRILSPIGLITATLAGAALSWIIRKRPLSSASWGPTLVAGAAGILLVLYSFPYCVASYRNRPVDPERYPGAYRGSLWPARILEIRDRYLNEEDLEKIAFEDPYYLPVHRREAPSDRPLARVEGPTSSKG